MISNLIYILTLALYFFPHEASSQKAILLSSSLGYYNIRQVNNIVKIYQHFRKNGFGDQDILLLVAEMHPCCQKNHRFGSLSFYDGQNTNIFKDVQVDYYQSQITLQSFADILMGYYSKFTLNKRKLELAENEPLFIYVTGHGGQTYFKIRERQALIDQQFAKIFDILYSKNVTKSVALISDSCSAISPFEKIRTPNFIAMGSSSYGQKSQSHGFDAELNQPKSDDFSFYFDQILSQKAIVKGLNNLESWTFKDLLKYMDKQKLNVNSKLISNNISKNEKIIKYVKKKQPQIKLKQHRSNIKIQQFLNS